MLNSQSVRPADCDIERVVQEYSNMLFKICFLILCDEFDAEDAVQETFYRYIRKAPVFRSGEHEKAWLITVATNVSKNMRRFRLMHTHVNVNDLHDFYETDSESALMESVLSLPTKYKLVIHLHYYEGYKTNEISKMLGVSQSTVLKRLQRGRTLLKEVIGGT